MDVTAELEAPHAPAELYPWVDDLARYPAWLTIVARAQPTTPDPDGQPAWLVDLTGQLGPLKRSKRLRMVRTVAEPERLAVYERRERDGRQHAPWVLQARITPVEGGSHLAMRLHYGGALWGPLLERMLRQEIDQARPRLLALLAGR